MLGLWTVAVSLFSRHLPDEILARVLSVMGMISVGFLLFMLLTSNPFARLLPAAPDGRDLNPLLQDPAMVAHPPMLYMGYVGFSVAFAFAISALISGRLDATWARWSRPWTTVAWMFLTVGIALGSWWAYYELGWGGWWFWDPVENASFMPWLVGTALIHSLAVTEKRGGFKSWTVLLAISAFSLSLLGTFLVRSGVLTSVHAFATDPKRGIFILAFLVIVIGGSLVLYAWRARQVGLGGKFDVVSRESLLLSNNVLLAVAAGSVLLGTVDGSGYVFDGRRADCPLEKSKPSRTSRAPALGLPRQRCDSAHSSFRFGPVEAARRSWPHACALDNYDRRPQCLAASEDHLRTAQRVSEVAKPNP
jgi:cytochrome c-type biogenesis protein CcmF